jgi:hypothetical protein
MMSLLTTKQMMVLRQSGLTDAQIAAQAGISRMAVYSRLRTEENRDAYNAKRRADRAVRLAEEPMEFKEIGRRLGITGQYAGKLYRSGMRKLMRECQTWRTVERSSV